MTLPSTRVMRCWVERRSSPRLVTARLEGAPNPLVAEEERAGPHQLVDVGPLVELLRRQLPDAGEGGVEEAQAAVRAEHRDAFLEIVERLALHARHGVEAGLEIDALGDVLEQIGDAAGRVRRGDDAQRPPARQMPPVLGRLERAIGLVELLLPGAEVGLLGQPALHAQAVEDLAVERLLVEECRSSCQSPRKAAL